MQIECTAGSGRCTVKLILNTTEGKGLCGFLTGGSKPHVGGVAYAVPRPKSSGDGLTADVSSICGPGHKDVYAAQTVAKSLCLLAEEPVCICAGLHVDGASGEELKQMMAACQEAAETAAAEYRASREG